MKATDDADVESHGRAIIAILAKQERGDRAADVIRRRGVSQSTVYDWKAKFGGDK